MRSRAEPCGAVPCPSLRCCVAALCAFFRKWSSTGYNACCCVRSTTYFSSFFFFHMYLIFHDPLFSPHANYPRTAHQNVTSVTKTHSIAEHNRAIYSARAALGIIKSLFARNHGPLLSAPFCMFSVAFILALRECSGRRQPPAERSPCM